MAVIHHILLSPGGFLYSHTHTPEAMKTITQELYDSAKRMHAGVSFRVPESTTPEQYADFRDSTYTDHYIAYAIWAIAESDEEAEEIWGDPTEEQVDFIEELARDLYLNCAPEEVIDHHEYYPGEPARLYWGAGELVIDPEEIAEAYDRLPD